jgi:hypothetical protein
MKRTNYFNIAIITFVIIAIAAIGYYGYEKSGKSHKTYSNNTYGITFTYPSNYNLEENATVDEDPGTVIVLTDKKSVIPSDGEGPVAITIGMYPLVDSASSDSLLDWVKTSPHSNFSLSNKTSPDTTTIADQEAYLYTWDGLYNGTTVATLHNKNVIVFSVTYDGNSDMQIRQDFTDLVMSVAFSSPEISAIKAPTDTIPTGVDIPRTTTLSGTYECLPHAGNGDFHTMECAFGIKAENGFHYALDLSSIEAGLANTEMNAPIKVTGTLVPIEQISTDKWQSYDIKGIMKVDAFTRL